MKEKKTFRQMVDEKMAKRGYERLPDDFNEQTNHMRFLPLEQQHFASSEIHFTPGVPTEDGWYVVNVNYRYEVCRLENGTIWGWDCHPILSHAKLPEL